MDVKGGCGDLLFGLQGETGEKSRVSFKKWWCVLKAC